MNLEKRVVELEKQIGAEPECPGCGQGIPFAASAQTIRLTSALSHLRPSSQDRIPPDAGPPPHEPEHRRRAAGDDRWGAAKQEVPGFLDAVEANAR
jgi:hypothetical protein